MDVDGAEQPRKKRDGKKGKKSKRRTADDDDNNNNNEENEDEIVNQSASKTDEEKSESDRKKRKKKGRSKDREKKKKEKVDSVENVAFENDSLVQEEPKQETSINLEDESARPSIEKRSSSLKEIVVESPRAQSPDVAIDIPDSPRKIIEEPEFQKDNDNTEAIGMEEQQQQQPEYAERPSSAQRTGTPERPSSAPKSSTLERPSSAQRAGTPERPSSAQRIGTPERPSSAQRTGTPDRTSSAQRTGTPTRPSSAERKVTPERPNSAHRTGTPERPSSAQRTDTPVRPSSAEIKGTPEKPSSGQRNSISERPSFAQRNSTSERPSSAQRTGTPERPSSAQRNSVSERPSSGQRTSISERPNSAQVLDTPQRPSSAQRTGTPERPSSAQRNGILERPTSAQRTGTPERPSSAQRNSVSERPSSAIRSGTPERPGSAQQKDVFERPNSAERSKSPEKEEIVYTENVKEVVVANKESSELLAIQESELEASENIERSAETDEEVRQRNLEPNSQEDATIEGQDMQPPDTESKESQVINPPEEGDLPWAMYTKMKNRNEEEVEKQKSAEDEMAEQSESDDDQKYVPPTNEDLPDLYEVMGSLDTDEIQLNLKTSPPSIMESDQQKIHQKQVLELKQGLAEEEIKVYLDEFEKQVEQEILMIGNISLEDVQDEERRLREEHISFQQQQAKVQRQRQQEILQAMERAKKYVMSKYKEKYRELRMREEHLMQRDRTYKDEIHRAFRRSESQLRKALKRRKAEVKTMYGDLIFADGQYGGSKGHRWKIDWNRAPQPIQIRLKCLRGVKDKLPGSRYVLMVSLYNRLGGNVMKWSNLKGQQWGGATLPIYHAGEFFNIELKIDQSVFTVCPSRPDIRPGMVLIFELFILRGSVTPTDKVVGWGCFPICDAEFNVVEGKYKTPMLRGDMDPGIDKFEIIEKLMAEDLENWLCNFYFEIIKLPRYMAGQKEYEVELQFTSGLLSSPDRTKSGEENIDGEKAVFGSRSDINSPALSRASYRSGSILSSHVGPLDENGNVNSEKTAIPNILTVDTGEEAGSSGSTGSRRKSSMVLDSEVQMFRAESLSANLRKRKSSVGQDTVAVTDPLLRPMTSVAASRKLVEEKGLQLSDDDDDGDSSGTDYGEHDILALKKNEGFKPVKGQPGMFYKIHNNTPSDVYAKKIYTMMPKTALLSKQKRKKKLTHLEELDTHSFPVKSPWSNKGHIQHKGTKKVQYMGRMLLSELGISQVKSREFWAMILMLLITYWMRLYCHYIGQWMALLGFLIPLNKFEFLPYTVNLNYQNTLLRTREEIALIVIGPFTNIILFLMMVVISAFIQFLFGRFSNIFSRFIIAFGIHCLLDPIWILITDSALERFRNRGGDFPIGDAFKLYWHFSRYYNNDNVTLFVSIALTVFLYTVTMFSACTILYMYFLRIHNNGRLMDVYWRLHGKHGDFFMAYDLEISNEELNFVCSKAERWRGEEGERRKTAVYDYIWEEEEMADEDWDNPTAAHGRKTGARETTTHVSIHTLHLDGLRELYRHFLKLPDGAIVEVFGEMNIPGIDEGVKQALIKRTTFQTMTGDGARKRRPSRGSSTSSVPRDEPGRKSSGSFLDVPASSSLV
ncbi:uncharacterized protein LOC130646936 [Hydractinia symbiolongicarpus]|uniref:uncharacterized protein LOC130646936 n=1 Tax=Hydractinia symbiolongicarpus TaxID=13093 RepID=UPI00254CC1C7|nr:uncharacterized protein LOC130646936 [Hydractinia symbiolongicarpus]XP_057308594.1 uncharacterized protein LOC130646936 [Hydractinia symbiolongicarpus]